MDVDSRAYWVWLQHALGAGSSKPNRILENYRTLEDFFAAGLRDWRLEGYFTPKELEKLESYSPADAAALIQYGETIGQRILTREDKEFPELLRQIHNPPCVLYVKGNLPDFSETPAISIVGTRRATATGIAAARSFAFGLAKNGAAVVSGGALGIDTAAHQGALQAGGKTVCVLGCGIDYNYLMGNASLREAISFHGAVISEYPPGTPAVNSNFPIRNRIISGLSLGTLVVEAAGKSGSLITADYALEQGRDVFSVPGGIYSPVSQGVNNLIKAGAKPVSMASEILEEYPAYFSGKMNASEPGETVVFCEAPQPVKQPKKEETLSGLSENAVSLYKALAEEPLHISELAQKTGIATPALLTAVTELELAEKIDSHSGRRYSLPH